MVEQESRPNCTTCGLPLTEPTCRACGGTSAPIALADGLASAASAFAPDPGRPELELAHDAWKSGDFGRLVSHCLAAEGINDAKMQQGAEGPTFKAMVRGLSTIIRVLSAAQELVIEVPVVRLPLTQYVPSLRVLLEMSDRDDTPTRFSVRGDLVMARFVGRLASMHPTSLCAALQAVATVASDAARLLIGALQAREISADEHRSMAIDSLPRGVVIGDELPTSSAQAVKKQAAGAGLFDSIAPLVDGKEGNPRATPVGDIPAVLMPPGGMNVAPPQRQKVPTPARIGRPTPGFIATTGPAPKPPAPARPRPDTAPATAAIPPTAPVPAPPPPARGLVPPPKPSLTQLAAANPVGRTMVSADGAAITEPSAQGGTGPLPPAPQPGGTAPPPKPMTNMPPTDPLGDTFMSNGQPNAPPPKTGSAADGLCELLHRAQTLGAVLSFADQPATMCLLIRATVYRAIQEFDSATPNAVSALYQATLPMTREIYITAPGMRRGSMAIPATSPAFEIMARIVAQRGEIEPTSQVQVQPITTAQDAKQHLARYVSEIDQAPADAELRHFLALGALSELLVRTKLPPATQDRLRGILAHAKKEGAKQPVVDLMMTALTRMIA